MRWTRGCQVRPHVESLAERCGVSKSGISVGGFSQLYAADGNRCLGCLSIPATRMAVCVVCAPRSVSDHAASGLCQLPSISGAGHVAADCTGCGCLAPRTATNNWEE